MKLNYNGNSITILIKDGSFSFNGHRHILKKYEHERNDIVLKTIYLKKND